MAEEQEVGPVTDLAPGDVRGVGRYAVGNAGGELFAVTRRCRHSRPDLAGGTIDSDGMSACPWHGATYDVRTGPMDPGPAGCVREGPRPRRRLPVAHPGPPAGPR